MLNLIIIIQPSPVSCIRCCQTKQSSTIPRLVYWINTLKSLKCLFNACGFFSRLSFIDMHQGCLYCHQAHQDVELQINHSFQLLYTTTPKGGSLAKKTSSQILIYFFNAKRSFLFIYIYVTLNCMEGTIYQLSPPPHLKSLNHPLPPKYTHIASRT